MKKWPGFAGDVTVIFDTDILIWVQRGNTKAADLVDREEERLISVQTYMELLQCAENRRQQDVIKQFLKDFGFQTLPLTENTGHRAAIYIEEFSLSHGVRTGDAIIAATAAENNLTLCSGNAKHFKPIQDLKLRIFRP
jgi:predicted nucleic acid-binding protein